MTYPQFKISTEGTSGTVVLSLNDPVSGWTPIARFYAGRVDQALLDLIVAKLNAS